MVTQTYKKKTPSGSPLDLKELFRSSLRVMSTARSADAKKGLPRVRGKTTASPRHDSATYHKDMTLRIVLKIKIKSSLYWGGLRPPRPPPT